MKSRLLNNLILLFASLIGLIAFVYPFFQSNLTQGITQNAAHAQDASLMTILIILLCLGAVMASLGSGEMNSKVVAILGVMTAANAVIRAVPGPAGFSLVFALPVLCGYVYGPSFGFMLGSLSILVSAFIGAGIGPWLPYQMFATGWVGLTSALMPKLWQGKKGEVALLGVWGFVWGLVFGAIMNIWFWPYVFQSSQADMYYQPGMRLLDTLKHYAVFYGITSFWWDLGRAVGNALLIWLFGVPIIKLLRRFQRRFHFEAS